MSARCTLFGGIGLLSAALLAAPSAADDETQATVQVRGRSNPLARDAAAVKVGHTLYLDNCAVCHGQDATGSMAANLVRSRTVVRGSDSQLYRVIVDGIPGTEMPPQPDFVERQVWSLVSYLHSLARAGLQPPVPGDPETGREVFETAGCIRCHSIDGAGGFLGPPLDSISTRKTSGAIRRDILHPDSSLAQGYGSVVALTEQGERIEGLLRNEDSFSLQILTHDGSYRLLDRGDLREVHKLEASAMPRDFGEKLTAEQLQNLLAFLDRQRDPFIPFDRGFGNY